MIASFCGRIGSRYSAHPNLYPWSIAQPSLADATGYAYRIIRIANLCYSNGAPTWEVISTPERVDEKAICFC
jgi:hypothetical protein